MNEWLVILNIVAFLVLAGVLVYLQRKHVSFSKRVFTALGLGLLFGFGLQWVYGKASEELSLSIEWYNVVGYGYVKLLQMVTMPLVFISILSAFTKLKLTKNLGKIAGLILLLLIGTTAVSAAVGISTTFGFHLEAVQIQGGDAELLRGQQLEQTYTQIQDQSFPSKVLQLLPANPFLDFTGQRPTSTIAVVIFACYCWIGLLRGQKKRASSSRFL